MLKLFNRQYSLFIHGLTWFGISIIHFLTLWIGLTIPIAQALVDSLIFNSIFTLITIGLWYVVDNFKINNKISYDQIITIISTFVLSIVIWVYAGTHLLRVVFDDDVAYLKFLEHSFNFRIMIGVVLYVLNFLFFFLLKTINQLHYKEEQEKRITKLLKETELEALKTQINPHFLFNSLNSINALTRSNPEKASDMILQLSDYMRYSLNQQNDRLTTLDHEIENLEKYLSIEKIRFGNKLNYSLIADDKALKMKIPPMLLQPLFENAIKHGLYSLTEGFYLNVEISALEHNLKIEITNNFDRNFPSKEKNGVGINNVKNRLLNIYGRADLISITPHTSENTFVVSLNIPQYE